MSPDQKRLPQLKLSELLDGKTISLCSGLHESSEGQIKVGIVEPTYIDSLLVDDDDQQIGYKGFLGRTIRENRSLSSIGDRVARAMGVVVDETGKLRCPPKTPNANQFTDLQMTGCMDIAGASRAIVNGVDAVADSAMNGIAGARNAGIRERTQRVIEKHGPLDTLEQQGNALSKAFPNAAIVFKDRFLNRITPGGRRKIAEARKSFVVGLLAEADEFPDVAQSISQISDRLGFVNGRGSYAMTVWSPQTAGIGIHMSQWSATSIGGRLARRVESTTAKKQGLGTTHANGLNAESPLADRWHHFAVHEFGHAVDFHQGLASWGFEARPGKSGAAEFAKVRPANDPLIEAELQNIAQQLQDSKNDKKISSDQLSKLGAELFAKEFIFGRQLDPAEIEMLDGVLGSAYASMAFDKSGSIHEHIAELFAQVRIAGYGSEIPSSNQDIIVRQLRDILRDVLGREIPGADDVAGGRQLGDIKAMESADTKGMGRRLARRVQRFIPLHMRRDGDNDGNVVNPLTGEDDVPVARVRRADAPSALTQGQRSIANTRARTIIANKPKFPVNRMAAYDDEDDDPDEILRRLGIPTGGASNAKPDKWNLNNPPKPTGGMPSISRPIDPERRRIKFNDLSLGELQTLGDELIDFDKQLREEFADSVDDRNKKRVNKLKFRLLGLLKESRIAQDGKGVTIEADEDLLKRIYKGIEALNALSDRGLLDDDLYPMIAKMRTQLLGQARKLYRSDFSDFPIVEKSALTEYLVKAVFRRPGKRGGRAIRRIFKKPDFDGDGDGFITNPRTGRDDLPFKEPRMPATGPKKRSLLASLGRPKKQSLSNMAWAQPADPDPTSDSSWAGRLRSLTKQFDSVKDRPWSPIALRAAEIESVVEARFGKLETSDEIKKAFKTALPTTKIRFMVEDEVLEEPTVRAEIIGHLYAMTRQPDHFTYMRKLEIFVNKSRQGRPTSSASATITAFSKRWRESGGSYVDHLAKGSKLDAAIFLSTKGVMDDGRHLAVEMRDTVPAQIAKSYLSHIKETGAIEKGLVTEEEVYNTAMGLFSIAVGTHESAHLMHYARSSAWSGKETPDEIVQKVDETLLDPNTPKAVFRSWFGTELAEAMDIFAKVDSLGGPEMLQTAIDIEPDGPTKDAMIMLQQALENNYLVSNPILPIYAAGEYDSPIRQEFRVALQSAGGNVEQALAKLFWGDDPDNNTKSEDLFRDMMEAASSQGLTAETADDVIEQLSTIPELAVAQAIDKLLTDRLWDDLSSSEIKSLRSNWKYISSYAKDKNSFNQDRHASRPSVEGVAEAFVARIFGLSFIKDKPEAEAALNKLLTWMLSMPEPAMLTAFDQLIASLGDIDNIGDDDADGLKSLYHGLDNASKDLFLLLGLREPS